jgi:hypothetical protein
VIPNYWLVATASIVCSVASATSTPPTWSQGFHIGVGCNDAITSSARLGDGRYVLGGAFSNCGDVAVDGLALFDPTTQQWSAFDPTPPQGAGFPVALHASGGELVVVSSYNGAFHWSGKTWTALGPTQSELVGAAILDGEIYIAGLFGSPQDSGIRVARWSGTAWIPLRAQPSQSDFDEWITSLVVFRGELYAAGYFGSVSSEPQIPVKGIARWNGTSWLPVGSGGGNGLAGGGVNAMTVWDDALYATGSFTHANSDAIGGAVPASQIASWDGTQWSAVGSGLQTGGSWLLSGGDDGLFAGGNFTQAGAETVRGLARWDGAQWRSVPGAPSSQLDAVYSLSQGSKGIIVGGRFGVVGDVGSSPIIVNHVAEWDGADWSKFGGDYGAGLNGPVLAIGRFGEDVFVGGAFTSAGGKAASYVARWDGSQWHPLGVASSNGFDGYVRTFEIMDDRLVIGGQFQQARNADGPFPAHLVAVWDGDALSSLGSDIPGTGQVNDLVWSPPDLFAGGFFGTQNPTDPHGVARWDGAQWSALGTAPYPGLIGGVNALAMVEGKLIGGGYFSAARRVDGVLESLNKLARWDGLEWLGVGVGGGSGVGHSFLSQFAIHAIAPDGYAFYVAGGFDLVNPVPPGIIEQRANASSKSSSQAPLGSSGTTLAKGIARWTGNAWEPLGIAGSGPIGTVHALSLTRAGVLVGGRFDSVLSPSGAVPAKSLARWHQQTWTDVGAALVGQDATVYALAADARRGTYVAGSFGSAGGEPASHFTYYDADPGAIFVAGFEP